MRNEMRNQEARNTVSTEIPAAGRGRTRRVALAMGIVAGTILLAELIVRVTGIGPPACAARRTEPAGGVPFQIDADGLLRYQPNSTFTHVYDPTCEPSGYFAPDGRIRYRLNNLGFRGPDFAPEKTENSFRVLCLGDSFAFGEGVREEDAFPARLAVLLSPVLTPRRVESINAGVQAHGTVDEVALYLRHGRPLKPDVIVLQFFLNDATGRAETIREFEEAARPMELSALARVSRIWEIIERGSKAHRLQAEYFDTTRRSFATDQWSACRKSLLTLKQTADADGTRVLVVIFPMLHALDGDYPFEDLHRLIHDACREARCEYLDLLPVFRGRDPRSLWAHPTDQHPNAAAHKLAAEAVVSRLGVRSSGNASIP